MLKNVPSLQDTSARVSGLIAAALVEGLTKAAQIEDQASFEEEARSFDLAAWHALQARKAAAVGGLTGLFGGPAGVALEATDLAYLFVTIGRACLGTGAIINRRPVDYQVDLPLILSLWAGGAEALTSTELMTYKAGSVIAIQLGGRIGAQRLAELGVKVALKSSFKLGSKGASKTLVKASAKLAGKVAAKLGARWVPVLGGAVSAAINYWVVKGILDAATRYYEADVLVLPAALGGDAPEEPPAESA